MLIELKAVLLACLLINYGLLLVWALWFMLAKESLFRWQSALLKIDRPFFVALNVGGITAYKLCVLFFNAVPLLALYWVG